MPTVESSVAEMTRRVAVQWFDALKAGDVQRALDCLSDDVIWINSPPDRGLSDIIPWLGEYRGRDAVAQTFVIWKQWSEVR